jgi:hypothetical protein
MMEPNTKLLTENAPLVIVLEPWAIACDAVKTSSSHSPTRETEMPSPWAKHSFEYVVSSHPQT